MIGLLTRWFAAAEPVLGAATPRDAAGCAVLHATAFRRGWSDSEFEHLLTERNVVAHRALAGRTVVGFILSRRAANEAEILSVAVAGNRRGRGLGRKLLDLHLGWLAGLGTTAVFLEVDEDNQAATRLYRRAGFREVGRRPAYYAREGAPPANALVLRRDLA